MFLPLISYYSNLFTNHLLTIQNTNYNTYIPKLFQLSDKVDVFAIRFCSFQLYYMDPWNSKIHNIFSC